MSDRNDIWEDIESDFVFWLILDLFWCTYPYQVYFECKLDKLAHTFSAENKVMGEVDKNCLVQKNINEIEWAILNS